MSKQTAKFNLKAAALPSNDCWVLKLGGSLLDLPDLPARLLAIIGQTTRKPLLVVGGGMAADCVRDWERIHRLESTTSHWLAVRAMEFNECMIASLLPVSARVICVQDVQRAWNEGHIALLNAFAWLKRMEGSPEHLPHSWDVTSDSIAADAAIRFQAAGLMLLKSVDLPSSIASVDDLGPPFVDVHFHRLVPRIPQIGWCNLAADSMTIKTASRQL
jgi:aspartokinase-like uncharacterized kinase